MARRTASDVTRPERTAAPEAALPAPGWWRRAAWLVAALTWVALFAALASFSRSDWPSEMVAYHRSPPANLLGTPGALLAYQLYCVFGPGIWVPMIAAAWMLSVTASGRVIPHPLLRLLGLALMTVAASSLIGWWIPRLAPIVGAECGLVPGWAFEQLLIRFSPFATGFVLVSGLLLGAIVAMDELLVAVPGVVLRSMTLFEPLWQLDPRPLLARFRSRGRLAPVTSGAAISVFPSPTGAKAARRKVTDADREVMERLDRERRAAAVLEDPESDAPEAFEPDVASAAVVVDADEDAAEAFPEEEMDGTEEVETEDASPARRGGAAVIADEEEDEGDLEDATDAEEEEGSLANDASEDAEDTEDAADAEDTEDREKGAVAAAPAAPLSADELRQRISRLPVRMAGRKTEVARDEDIPREVDYTGYQFPGLDMLEAPEGNFSESMETFVREQAGVLTEALRTYQIDGEVVGIESGPVVTLYSVELAPGTRVARLETISKDIARSLQAPNIRIIPNMVGRTAVGIEVPNRQKEKVRLKELMSGGHSQGMTLPMFLGKDSAGEPLVLDLARMPHMLIAGTTGSGKSVCMNTIIMSWLYTKRPDELKLVLVDPKMVEMSQFADIPHLMCPVVTDMAKAAGILEWATEKMEERYELLKDAGVRDIRSYNDLGEAELLERLNPQNELEKAKIPRKLPYMVFVIDELADLMMTNKEVEHSIVRIAQKARAVGIHLILATQRPQANVVTGLIKSNMPCRVSFKVASGMDSRIVLDQKGAELLLGQGDMLVLTPSSSELRRAQGTLVTDSETRQVARFLKTVAGPSFERQLIAIRGPGARDAGAGTEGAGGEGSPDERDPLFDKAVEIMIESGRGSVSLLQRRLAIGYGRASRLVDQMGVAGILSDHKGSVAREVLLTLEDWKRMKAIEEAEANGDVVEGAAAAAIAEESSSMRRITEESGELEIPEQDGVPDEFPGEHRQ